MRRTLAAAAVGATSGPRAVLSAQVLLIAGLAATVALSGAVLSPAGWAVGVTCGVITNAGLAVGRLHYRADRLTRADWVTLARAALAVGVAALVADSFGQPVPVTMLVSLSALALALDAVDGWVARRTTTGKLGAQFDGEVDAFLILVLSVYVARSAGAWVLAIGTARYAFLAAGWPLPWMRAPLPPRYWRKVVAATQGIVLTDRRCRRPAAAVTTAALVVALVLLPSRSAATCCGCGATTSRASPRSRSRPDPAPSAAPGEPKPGRVPRRVATVIAAVLTILAALIVWVVLVAPDQPQYLTLNAFLRLPLEGLVLIALAVVLPARGRRILAVVVGLALALVVILKVLNYEVFSTFDRPFDPIGDTSQLGNGLETMRSLVGRTETNLIEVGAVVGIVVLVVLLTLAMLRLTRVAAGNRRWTLRAVAALGAVWALCWVLGAQLVSHTPIASTISAGLIVDQVHALQADIHDHGVFAKQINHDPFRNTPTDQLLTGLRGKDVLLVFVESYGQVAVQGSSFSPEVDAALKQGDKRLRSAGFSARSGFLNSATFGGISWLAHSSLQSGLWVDSQRRYNQLIAAKRFTLAQAFNRAGWRTVDDVPSNDRAWPQGETFYHYDKIYDRHQVGYHGPTFTYASMPDQYIFSALQRLELGKTHRRPLFAEVDTVSSHMPWNRIPHTIAWKQVGNGSIFNKHADDPRDGRVLEQSHTREGGVRHVDRVLDEHADLVRTALRRQEPRADRPGRPSAVADRQRAQFQSRRADLDHRPRPEGAQADRRLGLEPGPAAQPTAPVWPMSAFRDRFLTAFDSKAATP